MKQESGFECVKVNGSLFNRPSIRIGIIGAAYFLFHWVAFAFSDRQQVIMAIWPAAGIGLSALLLNPKSLWPAILAALFVTGVAADVFLQGRSFAGSCGFMLANIIESAACAWLISKWAGFDGRFSRVREVVALIIGAVVVNAATACIGAATGVVTHADKFWSLWSTWWIADGLGILLFTPMIVTWADLRLLKQAVSWPRVAEFGLFLIIWVLAAYYIFNVSSLYAYVYPRPYILLALLAWAALRFGQRGTATALGVLAVVALTSTSVVVGPSFWGGDTYAQRILAVQLALAVTSGTMLLMAASYAQAKSSEKLVRKNWTLLKSITDGTSDEVFIKDLQGRYMLFNQAAGRFVGRSPEEVIGKDDTYIFPADQAKLVMEGDRRTMAAGHPLRVEEELSTADGLRTFQSTKGQCLDESAKVIGTFGIARDITDLRRMERERLEWEIKSQQAHKLESIGILAGGIAHDFNNMLTAVFGYLERAQMMAERTLRKDIAETLAKAGAAVDRAKALTNQLLTFSKGGSPSKRVKNLEPILRKAAVFSLSGSNIEVEFSLPKRPVAVQR